MNHELQHYDDMKLPFNQLGFSRFGWLVAIIILVLASTLTFYFYQLLSSTAENNRSARIFEQSLTASIDQYEYLPALIARDESVVNILNNPEVDHTALSDKLAFITTRSGADDIFVQNINGNVVATSNYQREKHNFYGKNYAFRPYFQKAKLERKRQFYFAKGATTGIPGFFISAPVMIENRVLGVVVVKLELLDWEKNWQSSKDNVLVSDKNGVVILSSDDDWKYQLVDKVSEQSLQNIYINKQFPGETHELLYSRDIELNFLSGGQSRYWTIGKSSYLVNNFLIGSTEWTLHNLVDHQDILSSVLLFFLVSSLLGFFLYLFMRERENKLEFRRKASIIETQRREDLQKLIDNIHIGVFVFDTQGKVLSMNEHAEHLLLSSNRFEGADIDINIKDFFDIDIEGSGIDHYLLEDIATPAYHEAEANIILGDETVPAKVPVMFAISKLRFADSDGYLMTLINIVRRKKVEQEIVRLNSSLEETVEARTKELQDTQMELIQKNKAAALGNMAATIVHELSQPLAAINSSVAAIQSKTKRGNWDGASESISRLMPLSSKMNHVIKLLKYFSYEDSTMVESVTLSSLVSQAVEVLKDQINEKNITVDIEDTNKSVSVLVSPIKIDLAISNLLKNAIDAVEKVNQPIIHITTEAEDNVIRLHIEDNGGGVNKQIMGQLFNPYFTTKEVGKGMGLGLSITYEVVQQHDGKISAVNIRKGARFTIELPILQEVEGHEQMTGNNVKVFALNRSK